MKIGGATGEEEEAGELTDNSTLTCLLRQCYSAILTRHFLVGADNLHINSIYAPLENFDKETIAAKRVQLAALGNRRIWASLGLDDKPQRSRACGLIISKTGEMTYVRPLEK